MDGRYLQQKPSFLRQPLGPASGNQSLRSAAQLSKYASAGNTRAMRPIWHQQQQQQQQQRGRSHKADPGVPGKEVITVLEERRLNNQVVYFVVLADGTVEKFDRTSLLKRKGGRKSLREYQQILTDDLNGPATLQQQPLESTARESSSSASSCAQSLSSDQQGDYEDELSFFTHNNNMVPSTHYELRDIDTKKRPFYEDSSDDEIAQSNASDSSYDPEERPRPRSKKTKRSRNKKDHSKSSWPHTMMRPTYGTRPQFFTSRLNYLSDDEDDFGSSSQLQGNNISFNMYDEAPKKRRSSRATKHQKSMAEVIVDDDYTGEEVEKPAPRQKVAVAKEVFLQLSSNNTFHQRHNQVCDACHVEGDKTSVNFLVCCQGCSSSYHKDCLGPRSGRQHLVTKVSEGNFVLQCRRCVDFSHNTKDAGPRLSVCQTCAEPGNACKPFRARKTPSQEQQDRDQNGGQDPVVEIPPTLLYQSNACLFRCRICARAFHFEHLPPHDSDEMEVDGDIADERFAEYSPSWQCMDCLTLDYEIQALIAWRPLNMDIYVMGSGYDEVEEDNKEYLIKWKDVSYAHCSWKPGAWVWGVSAPAMRKAFAKNVANRMPHMTIEDAIPEDYRRVDIVYDVRFLDSTPPMDQDADHLRIAKVSQALVKFKGLQCDNVVWDSPPEQSDTEAYTDFKLAYDNWVAGRYIHLPSKEDIFASVADARQQHFETTLMKKEQPATLTGGKLMDYQMEGLNWLYYNWAKGQNAILADEMGLGKTIQIIGLLDTLVHSHQCWPLLIVVPNPTVMNWKREIQRWAPSLRVVTFFGTKESVAYSQGYELFHSGTKDLKCHVVITSFQTPVDHKLIFKGIPWQGLVVDEGHRLKNDKGLLYKALEALNIPFRVLLTGTPLQNNIRELFNLLQFLRSDYNAESLESKYSVINKDTVTELHRLIRPFFLRRTKAQVLTFLPPMAEIILPVTMSTVQQKLYKSILAKNPNLIRSIFHRSPKKMKSSERQNLNNILMQLRKCLCHPFMYSKSIEDRSVSTADSIRNLIEASSKLQLLEIMLPKLKERGHRVLLFSQFLEQLDIIEDFLLGLDLKYERLDGSMSSLAKQRRIDAFNEPNSELFAFLLSTRSGGVGINLATADTVIIMDPDFNPHQDIQALSRAHRLGQKKKVLVFHLMTRDSVEEKIMQIGKKKLSLDHVVIEQMAKVEEDEVDVESVLKFGASALFEDNKERMIRYSPADLETLLDRSKIENTRMGDDKSAENAMSFARVWQNDKAAFEEGLALTEDDELEASGVWEKILEERELAAAREAAANEKKLGRGHRNRLTIDYRSQSVDVALALAEDHDISNDDKEHISDADFQIPADGDSEASDSEGRQLNLVRDESKKFARGLKVSISPQEKLKGRPAKAVPNKQTPQKQLTPTIPKKPSKSKNSKMVETPTLKAEKAVSITPKQSNIPNVKTALQAKNGNSALQKTQTPKGNLYKKSEKPQTATSRKSLPQMKSSSARSPSQMQTTSANPLSRSHNSVSPETLIRSTKEKALVKSRTPNTSPSNGSSTKLKLPAGKRLPSATLLNQDIEERYCNACMAIHAADQCLRPGLAFDRQIKCSTSPISSNPSQASVTSVHPQAPLNSTPNQPKSQVSLPQPSGKCTVCNLSHEPGKSTCIGMWPVEQMEAGIVLLRENSSLDQRIQEKAIKHLQQLLQLAQARELAKI